MAGGRALVLGAGGHAAHAWEIGLIAGLAENGIDVRTADLFVGTSAGAVVAGQLTSGLSLDELFGMQLDARQQLPEHVPPVDFGRWRASIVKAKEASVGAVDFLQRVGSLADAPTAARPSEARNRIARRLPIHTWPDQPLLVATVDVTTGERRAFGRESGADFVDAVTASNAVPGIWPLVMIEGRGYMDGGFYSIDNCGDENDPHESVTGFVDSPSMQQHQRGRKLLRSRRRPSSILGVATAPYPITSPSCGGFMAEK